MVWQAQGVREFVAEKTDTINLVEAILCICWLAVQFIVDAIAWETLAIALQYALLLAVFVVAVESGGSRFRPETIGVIARNALGIAGVDDVYQVYDAITVRIIFREIHLAVYLFACLAEHLIVALVDVAAVSVFSIIGIVLAHGDRTHHIKLRGELSFAAELEVFSYGSIVGVSWFLGIHGSIGLRSSFAHLGIEIVVEGGHWVAALEFQIREFNEDDQCLGTARMWEVSVLGVDAAGSAGLVCLKFLISLINQVGFDLSCLHCSGVLCLEFLDGCFFVFSAVVEFQRSTIGGDVIAEVFIAEAWSRDDAAVGELNLADAWLCLCREHGSGWQQGKS